MTLTQITEKGIKDGEIVNADINASAAIAGSKISPTFTADGSISKATPQFKIHSNDNDMTMGEEVGRYAIWTSDGSAPGGGEVFRIKTESSSSLGLDYTTRLYNRQGSGGGATEVSLGNGQGSIYLATNTTGNAGAVTRMAVMSDGKVGIGTTSPSNKLVVNSAAHDDGLYVLAANNNQSTRIKLQGKSSSGTEHNWILDAARSVDRFGISNGVNTHLSILDSGKVGIGTTDPQYNLHVVDTYHFTVAGGNNTTGMKIGNYDGTNYGVLTTRGSRLRFDIGDTNKLDLQSTGQINHLGPLIFTKNDQANPYDSSLDVNDGSLAIRGDLGSGNYWGWRQRATADGSVSNTNAEKVLPSINDFQYPNNSNGMLIASTSKIGFAATAESPLYANGVQMLFDSSGLALGSGNAFDCTHSSTGSANTNVVIRTNGNISFKSGKGIDFALTGNATASGSSSTGELLDDYEQGTWTPVMKRLMSNNTTEAGYYTQQTQQGLYTKVGNRVHISGRVHWNGGSTGSGSLIIVNLPFSCATGNGGNEVPLNIGYRSGLAYPRITGYLQLSTNRFFVQFVDGSGSFGSFNISPSATSSTGNLYFEASYVTEV